MLLAALTLLPDDGPETRRQQEAPKTPGRVDQRLHPAAALPDTAASPGRRRPGETSVSNVRAAFVFACVLCPVFGPSALAQQPQSTPPATPRVLTDARLFHRAPPVPQRVWSDSVAAGVETVSIARPDGVTLRGWLYPSDPNAAWVIAFHGNNGFIADTFTQARTSLFFGQLGLNVVAFDYRGTGFSDGEIALKPARDDALAMYDFVAQKAAGKPVFVVGWSLGSIFASHVAASREAVAGLVLIAPIASAEGIAASFHAVAPPEVAEGMRNAAELRGYRNPLLVIHGALDSVVPIAQGREDYEAAASTDKRFVEVAGKNHGDGILSIEADDAIAAFFATHLVKAVPKAP